VLVLPSKLAPLAKDVFGTLVVNPGHLTRGFGGGSFAQLSIHPFKEDLLRTAVLERTTHSTDTTTDGSDQVKAIPHNICARTHVTVTRI
jgi:hypothetical protein